VVQRITPGDPLADFNSLALFGDIGQDPAFLRGYRAGGGTVTFDSAARQRLSLYRAYLNLIMCVEAVPPGRRPGGTVAHMREWTV
jgi:hypothetical protein